jgi:hypothetical protein
MAWYVDAAAGSGEVMMKPPDEIKARGPRPWVLIVFAVAIVAAAWGFSWKLFEFFDDLLAQGGLHFAGVHLAIYVLVAAGFLLLLAYAFLSGHFSDIERPKFEMLERERENDRREFD